MSKIFAIVNMVIFVIIIPVYSMGNNEISISMKKLNELVDEKRYDEVLQTIPNEIRNYPSQFDKYQKIVKEIIQIREDYNKNMYTVLEMMENNPEDEEPILKVMNDLIRLDPNAESTRLFVRDFYENISFSINRKKLFNIFESSSVAMTNSYKSAIEMYLSVFDMNRSEMMNSNEPSLDKVLELISSIENELIIHLDLQQDINNTVYYFILNFGYLSDEQVKMTMVRITEIYKTIMITKDTLINLGNELLEYEKFYNKNMKIKENNYIRFIYTSIFGISNYGLINTINQEWYIIYMNYIRKSLSHINDIQENVLVEYEQNKKISADKLFDIYRSINYIEAFTNIIYKEESGESSDDAYEMLPEDIKEMMSLIIIRLNYIKNNIMELSF